MEMQLKMKMYKQGEMSEVADGAPAKEKPQAGMLKKYSTGEVSNVPYTTVKRKTRWKYFKKILTR